MKSNIFLPERINVGYQERSGTYTGKLAYIIYYDQKGVLRKEKSWNSWRKEALGNDVFENVPTDGFVLNKKAGGYSSGWNHRDTYVRVYDPRGFEFEIDIENLLFILENTSSIKGKGLEGEFVYGWDGTKLILIPVESPDYKEINKYNLIVKENLKLKAKDLVIGGTYLTKDNEEIVYIGRYDSWGTCYDTVDEKGNKTYPPKKNGKVYYFYSEEYHSKITSMKSLTKIIGVVSEECHENYAEMFEALERDSEYSPIDKSKNEYLPYTFEEVEEIIKTKDNWNRYNGLDAYRAEDKKNIKLRHAYSYEKEKSKYVLEYKILTVVTPAWGKPYEARSSVYEHSDNLQELFDMAKPHYKNIYLANGKLYSEGKKTL